ncbi:MAG: hypothetical protein M3Q49_11525 [Actinomycetota bacterium]|nr:hypothetical protein [Actinomycetota bacterium]MDP9486389.1 hypothetical protein [Actinomycetota bacterium]
MAVVRLLRGPRDALLGDFHRRLLAVAIPAAVLVASYVVDALGNAVGELEAALPFTVFYYYGSAIEDGIEWTSFGSVAFAAVLLVLLAALTFPRRDIYKGAERKPGTGQRR